MLAICFLHFGGIMNQKFDLSTIIKLQNLAKKEIINGDLKSAKILLIKAKELLLELKETTEASSNSVA